MEVENMDEKRNEILERINRLSKVLNDQVLEVQGISSDLRVQALKYEESAPKSAEEVNQLKHNFVVESQEHISEYSELEARIQKLEAHNIQLEKQLTQAKIANDQATERLNKIGRRIASLEANPIITVGVAAQSQNVEQKETPTDVAPVLKQNNAAASGKPSDEVLELVNPAKNSVPTKSREQDASSKEPHVLTESVQNVMLLTNPIQTTEKPNILVDAKAPAAKAVTAKPAAKQAVASKPAAKNVVGKKAAVKAKDNVTAPKSPARAEKSLSTHTDDILLLTNPLKS